MTEIMFEGRRITLKGRWSVEWLPELQWFKCLWCRTQTGTYGRCDNCGAPKPTIEHVI